MLYTPSANYPTGFCQQCYDAAPASRCSDDSLAQLDLTPGACDEGNGETCGYSDCRFCAAPTVSGGSGCHACPADVVGTDQLQYAYDAATQTMTSVTTDGSAFTPTLGRTAITVHTKANTVPIQSQVLPFEPASTLIMHSALASAAAEVASSMADWFPPLKAVAMLTVNSSNRSHAPAWVPLWTISVLFSGGVSSIGVDK